MAEVNRSYHNVIRTDKRDRKNNISQGTYGTVRIGSNHLNTPNVNNVRFLFSFEHEGLLEIDGRDVRQYNPQTLHHHTTACFQDFQRYNLSTRENVGVGNWKLIHNDDSLESAMKKGGALEIVEEVGGLDAELTMFGGSVRSTQSKQPPNQPKVARLSGGQWQRVALSRAFIRSKDATLVVFE